MNLALTLGPSALGVILVLGAEGFLLSNSPSPLKGDPSSQSMTSGSESRQDGLRVAPDFRLKDQKGREYRLSDFKGGLVLINFWATWCPPCLEELPSMDALAQHFKAKPFTLIAISVDDGWNPIENFLAGLNRRPGFLILNDSQKQLAALYGTEKFPESYLIDGEGRIVKKFEGAFQWMDEQIVQEIESLMSRGSIPQNVGSKSTQNIKAK